MQREASAGRGSCPLGHTQRRGEAGARHSGPDARQPATGAAATRAGRGRSAAAFAPNVHEFGGHEDGGDERTYGGYEVHEDDEHEPENVER